MTTTPTTEARPTSGADQEAVRKAISSTSRPPRAGALSAALTFAWRGMLKVKHIPEQLLDVTITPVMFVLMFTYLFGGAIAGSPGEYSNYILPGILVMSVLFTTVYSGIALDTDLTKGAHPGEVFESPDPGGASRTAGDPGSKLRIADARREGETSGIIRRDGHGEDKHR